MIALDPDKNHGSAPQWLVASFPGRTRLSGRGVLLLCDCSLIEWCTVSEFSFFSSCPGIHFSSHMFLGFVNEALEISLIRNGGGQLNVTVVVTRDDDGEWGPQGFPHHLLAYWVIAC